VVIFFGNCVPEGHEWGAVCLYQERTCKPVIQSKEEAVLIFPEFPSSESSFVAKYLPQRGLSRSTVSDQDRFKAFALISQAVETVVGFEGQQGHVAATSNGSTECDSNKQARQVGLTQEPRWGCWESESLHTHDSNPNRQHNVNRCKWERESSLFLRTGRIVEIVACTV
jgi:hypothetical protein